MPSVIGEKAGQGCVRHLLPMQWAKSVKHFALIKKQANKQAGETYV